MNVKFINCGYTVNNFTKSNNLFPSYIKAAIILNNSFSITITNTIFENSPGNAVIGVNVMGKSYLVNVTVLDATSSKNENLAGGVVLTYPSTNISNNSNVKLFIKHCYIRNINNINKIENKSENSIIPLDQLSVAIGLYFINKYILH